MYRRSWEGHLRGMAHIPGGIICFQWLMGVPFWRNQGVGMQARLGLGWELEHADKGAGAPRSQLPWHTPHCPIHTNGLWWHHVQVPCCGHPSCQGLSCDAPWMTHANCL